MRVRAELAMSTSQSGLCRGCYDDYWRIHIEWISQFAYVTVAVRAEDIPIPDSPRGAHNYVLEGTGD